MESNSRTEVKQCLVEPSDRTATTRVDGRVMYDPRTSDHDSSSQISDGSATDQRRISDGPTERTDGPVMDEQTSYHDPNRQTRERRVADERQANLTRADKPAMHEPTADEQTDERCTSDARSDG